MPELRIDQTEALENLRKTVGAGHRRIAMQAPTGFGKTVLSAALVNNARAKKKKILFTVPLIGLIDQTVEMFWEHGIKDVGVIQATHHMTDWSQPIQIASVQTLQNRPMPDADVCIIDEIHRWFKFYAKWFCDPKWQDVPIIGLSATPWTKGLGSYFSHFVKASTTQELIDAGLLSPFRVFAPSHPDLSDIATVAGDYHEGQLSARMSEGKLVADTVETWLRLAGGRPTLCYGVDRVHAKHLQTKFLQAGVPCAYQDAFTKDIERKAIKRDFHSGAVKVVCNVGTLTTGVDWDVRCISLCRPTKSDMLFVQIVGRGLRTAPGKDHCLILDHSDNHARMGFVTDIDASHTALHDGNSPTSDTTQQIRLPKECPQCAYLKPPGNAKCPVCSFVAVAHSRIEPTPGELIEAKRKAKEAKAEIFEGENFYAQLRRYGIERGFKPGWAAMKYKDKHGCWPDRAYDHHPVADEVMPAVMSWIKSQQIRWIKGKGKQFRKKNDELPLSSRAIVPGTLCTEDDLRDLQ